MAECTTYSSLQVSGANQTEVNGTYLPIGTNEQGFTVYYLNGDTSLSYIHNPDSTWRLMGPIYGTRLERYITSEGGDCPSLGGWVSAGPGGGGGGTATVTGTLAGGGGGSPSSPAVKIENANVKFFGKTKFVV